ncbi:MAG TPA: redoxin domain-containing protein, partial [Burkholderiaceae bacterium]|nr:redoxin domain-containing protein [Burkholderiaceae bacterium]
MDRRTFWIAVALGPAGLAPAAWAALPNGQRAPDFTLDAALGGKPFKFSLAEALARGPVVLYFFPKAFTTGCTIEA